MRKRDQFNQVVGMPPAFVWALVMLASLVWPTHWGAKRSKSLIEAFFPSTGEAVTNLGLGLIFALVISAALIWRWHELVQFVSTFFSR